MDAKSGRGLDCLNFALGGLLLVALASRVAFLNVVSADPYFYLLPWFDQLSVEGMAALRHGLVGLLGNANANYAAPYYYLLWLATKFAGVLPPLWLIKIVSFCFDPIGSFFAYKIVRLYRSKRLAVCAAVLVFAAPTAIVNDAWFAQCDMLWTSLILGSLYFALKRQSFLSIGFFALAFSFKAQACFFAPFLLMLFLLGEIKFWSLIIAPVVYAAMLLPAIVVGVDWKFAATTYVRQGDAYHRLSSDAPNLYYAFGDNFYAQGVVLGLVLTTVASFALAALPRYRNVTLDVNERILAATMFLAVAPFLLPKMHDRYFFAADITSIILAILVPRLWTIPVMLQMTSLSAYVPVVSWNFANRFLTPTMPMAVMLCAVVVGYLVYEYWCVCTRPGTILGTKTKPVLTMAMAIIAANCLWQVIALVQHIVVTHACSAGAAPSLFCMGDLPGDWMVNGSWPDWGAFALIQLIAYLGARWAATRIWLIAEQDWFVRWSKRLGSCLRGPASAAAPAADVRRS